MEKENKESWMPKIGGKYYIIVNRHVGGRGVRKKIWDGGELDFAYYKQRNCFKSKKEAAFIFRAFGEAF